MSSSFWLLQVESSDFSQAGLSFSDWEKSHDSTRNSQKLEDMMSTSVQWPFFKCFSFRIQIVILDHAALYASR